MEFAKTLFKAEKLKNLSKVTFIETAFNIRVIRLEKFNFLLFLIRYSKHFYKYLYLLIN